MLAVLLVATAGAWVLTGELMGGMDAGPGTPLGDLGWFVAAWVAMMAAMMLPSVAPVALARARAERARGGAGESAAGAAMAAFVAGYLLAWGLAGVAGYAVVEGVRSLDLAFLAWSEGGAYVAAAVVLAAAIYQLTGVKGFYLDRCRGPVEFVEGAWRPGLPGALRMGIEHGALCIGCCWALMATLFALGVMSVGWMVLVAVLVATEKLLPWEAIASRGVAAVLVVVALTLALAPAALPGLTIPGSPEAMEAMEAMGMEADGMEMQGMDGPGAEGMRAE